MCVRPQKKDVAQKDGRKMAEAKVAFDENGLEEIEQLTVSMPKNK